MSPIKIDNPTMPKQHLSVYPASFDLNDVDGVIIEIGPGRGDFLFHLAQNNPGRTVVGIEIKHRRFQKLVERVERLGLKNICLVLADARAALPAIFKKNHAHEIHILFPDPWPKRRHKKNRLLCADFLIQCADVLKKNSHLYFTTDFEEYAKDVSKEILSVKQFKSCYDPAIKNHSDESFETYFAKKWKILGRNFYYQKYIKRGN